MFLLSLDLGNVVSDFIGKDNFFYIEGVRREGGGRRREGGWRRRE